MERPKITAVFIMLLSATLMFSGAGYGPHKPLQQTPDKMLRVMTYNIHHANPPSRPGFIDLDAIARVIVDSKADIVGLQEVENGARRSGIVNQTKLLAEKTGLHYYHFFKAIDYDGGDYGIAILSRYKLNDPELIRLPQNIKAEKRILAYAVIKVGKQSFIFANTHLDALQVHDNRIIQMQRIIEEFERMSLPVILVGDLNAVSGSEVINLLDAQFSRTCTKNCGRTVPQVMPWRTIDFIATKNLSWTLLKHNVIKETYASDHRPVIATFKLP